MLAFFCASLSLFACQLWTNPWESDYWMFVLIAWDRPRTCRGSSPKSLVCCTRHCRRSVWDRMRELRSILVLYSTYASSGICVTSPSNSDRCLSGICSPRRLAQLCSWAARRSCRVFPDCQWTRYSSSLCARCCTLLVRVWICAVRKIAEDSHSHS